MLVGAIAWTPLAAAVHHAMPHLNCWLFAGAQASETSCRPRRSPACCSRCRRRWASGCMRSRSRRCRTYSSRCPIVSRVPWRQWYVAAVAFSGTSSTREKCSRRSTGKALHPLWRTRTTSEIESWFFNQPNVSLSWCNCTTLHLVTDIDNARIWW